MNERREYTAKQLAEMCRTAMLGHEYSPKYYAIEKNGKLCKDFSEGTEFVTRKNIQWIEKWYDKKAAAEAAREYGRKNGAGYKVVVLF